MQAKVEKSNLEDIAALTPMQEGLLFLYLNDPESTLYFEQLCIEITGEIDAEALKKAWQHVVDSNEMLRTIYRWEKLEKPIQIVLKSYSMPIIECDFSELDIPDRGRLLKELKERVYAQRLDISAETCNVTLCRLEKEKYEMIINRYQIIYDGWSNGILLKELSEAYNCLIDGMTPQKKTKRKFKEYVKWIQTQDKEKQHCYWRNYLKGFDTKTALPYDWRKNNNKVQSKNYSCQLNADISQRLMYFIKNNRVTLASLLYAAWGILLQRYSNSDDVVFGTTISGRPADLEGIESVMGLFINTLPIRVNKSSETKVKDLLSEMMHVQGERVEYESTALLDIKKCSELDPMDNIFDSVIILENYPLDKGIKESGNKLGINSYSIVEPTNFSLTIQVMQQENIRINLIYNSNEFSEESIKRIAEHYKNVIDYMIGFPDAKISEVEILSETEKKLLLFNFNDTHNEYPRHRLIHELFEAQAIRMQDKIAAVFSSGSITYNELNKRANSLAGMLMDNGVRKDTIVGLYVPRSIEMIVGILGILKANAICLPLDIDHPSDRTDMILEDSGAEFLLQISESRYTGIFNRHILDIRSDKLSTYDCHNVQNKASSDSIAYIIYTSGSTGKPKGGMLHHYGIINHILTKAKELEITQDDIIGNNFSVNVVASIWQILTPLITGATLVVYPEEVEKDPYEQFKCISRDRVSVIEVIPSVLNAYIGLIERGKPKIEFTHLKKIALTSEETKVSLVEKFFRHYSIMLVDCYGQTECCDDTLHYKIEGYKEMETVPIGKPALNTRAYIVDRNFNLQPANVAGELCISGDGVGKGYWKRPELTAEKFVKNPFEPGKLMYRTGDLARWRKDGNVEYLGRIDHQVKIRGNRIELGEIESKLLRHKDIESAAVILRTDDTGNSYLSAYMVMQKDLSISQLREYLNKELPDYMIPSQFIQLDNMPLTPNGKIDRKALPASSTNINSGVEFVLPKNEVENKLLVIWKKQLNREDVSVKESFFELGGNSLMMVQLHAEISEIYPNQITIQDLFSYPTISKLAEFIYSKDSSNRNTGMIKRVELPEECFNNGKEKNEVFSYKYILEGNIYEGILKISQEVNVDSFDILLSLYMHILLQTAGSRSEDIQAIFDESASIIPISINMDDVSDFNELFKTVSLQKSKNKSMAYDISDLGKREATKDKKTVLPVIYKRVPFVSKINILKFFDIAISIENSDAQITLTFEYEGKYLASEKMKSMFNSYISLIKLYIQKYEFSLKGDVIK